jgi:PAS domain-containing protein
MQQCVDMLLQGLEEFDEPAAYYQGNRIVQANQKFADLFERDIAEFNDLPIIDICHNESIEMIRDFIKRRAHRDTDVPRHYEAAFRTSSRPRVMMTVDVLRLHNTEGAVLAILHEKR